MTARNFQTAPLAVVGMACRFPGADGLDAYWDLLREGRSGITAFPADRLDPELYYHPDKGHPGTSYSRVGGVVPLRPINRDICPITDEFASRYDLGHLTLCEVASAACRHAGYDPLDLPYPNTGVFIGNTSGGTDLQCDLAYHTYAGQMVEYLRELPAFQGLPAEIQQQVGNDVIASIRGEFPNRSGCQINELTANAGATAVSSLMGLSGPSMVTDAACAGSFVALMLGAQALHQRRIDMAIVGGAALRKWYELVLIAQAGTMSSNGSCPFDARADGLISSDGYAAILIKTLERAVSDGDQICGVIRGLGMSSDGRGKSFWAPRQDGQVAAIRRAYEGGLDPSRLQYIEAHATSTRLGDATEVRSLVESLGPLLRHPVPVASVKANIGHTLESAGLAGLIKTLLGMQHGIVPPAINYQSPSPEIDWDKTPFYLPMEPEAWPEPDDGHPRRAGVNAFGVGGLNLHVVVDQHQTSTAAARPLPTPQAHKAEESPAAAASIPGAPAEPDHAQAIAVIGAGSLFPGANTVDAFWELLASGRDPKAEVPLDRWNPEVERRQHSMPIVRNPHPRGGFITDFDFDWKKHKIPPKQIARSNPLHFMLIDAADQALADAGLGDGKFDRSRTGTVVGSIFAADFVSETYMGLRLPDIARRITEALRQRGVPPEAVAQVIDGYRELILRKSPGVTDDTGSMAPSTLASRISKSFDLLGGALTVDAGHASSLAALMSAVDLLQTGTCDMVVCAGAQRRGDLTFYEESALRGQLANGTLRAAFDAETDGFVPGDGVGVLVLKRVADARRDGHRIRAVIRGVGAASNRDSAEAAVRSSVRQALRLGGIEEDEVGLIETGAVGVPSRDEAELSALAAEYGTGREPQTLLLGSLSAQIGNTQGASGIASILKATLCLEHGEVPATFGLQRPHTGRDVFDFALTSLPIRAGKGKRNLIAGVTSLSEMGPDGAGGTAYHAFIQGGTRLMSQPAVDASPGVATRENQAAAEKPTLESCVLDFTEEQTGVPRFALDLDVDLEHDLHLDPARRSQFLRELFARTQTSVTIEPPNSLRSLAEVVAYIEEHDGTSWGVVEPAPPVQTAPDIETTQSAPVEQQAPAESLPADNQPLLASRFVLRTREASLPDDSPAAPEFHGPAVVLGSNAVAEALQDRLAGLGVPVCNVSLEGGVDGAVAQLDQLWQQHGTLPHLFVTTARDADAGHSLDDEAAWQSRREAGVLLPFLVCQRWYQLVDQQGLLDQGTLVAVTSLGGDSGFGGYSPAVEGAALAGLLKSIHAESGTRLDVKVIDSPPREPAKLIVTSTLRELAAGRGDVEVCYVRGRRQMPVAIPLPAATMSSRSVKPGGVWVVTGGARGITSVLAREIGSRFGLKLHLVGTRPQPQIDPSWRNLTEEGLKELKKQVLLGARASGQVPHQAWTEVEKSIEIDGALQACSKAGVEAAYHQCDVSDRQALAAVLDSIRRTHGPIDGVIHGAHLEAPCRFDKKDRETVSRVLATKVDGARNLMALTQADPLQFFVGFGSTTNRFGGSAQTDSALAGDMLCKMIARYRHQRPDCAAFAIDWTPWDNVGTAAASLPEKRGVRLLPAAEGVQHFVNELQAASFDSEILVVDHPDGYCSGHSSLPSLERMQQYQQFEAAIADSPLIDSVSSEGESGGVANVTYYPAVDPFLTGHVVDGVPLLPAVGGLETCAQAASILSGGRLVVGLRDIKLINGFRMESSRPHRAIVRVELKGDMAECTLCGDYYTKTGEFSDPARVYQSCTVMLSDRPLEPSTIDLSEAPTDWTKVPYPESWAEMAGANSGTVYYGPELRCLKQIHHRTLDSWGRLVAPATAELGGDRRGTRWHTPAAMIDALFFICDLYTSLEAETPQLPHSIGQIRVVRMPQPGERCVGLASFRGREGRMTRHSAWVAGENGQILMHFDDLLAVDMSYSLKDAMAERRRSS